MTFLKAVVLVLFAAGTLIALVLVIAQQPFADSRFEFGQDRGYVGVLRELPYPTLSTAQKQFLLVDPGKHGANPTVHGLDGSAVRLRGSLIERGPYSMLEVVAGSVQPNREAAISPPEPPMDLGVADVIGEIVDSKCFLGVMNPGNGKVHRDCAANCIRGGIPPAFLVRDASGVARVFLLTGSDGRALRTEVLPFVAEPVRVTGRMARIGTQRILKAEPLTIRRLE